MLNWLDVIILSIIEGITEFLPISSTGHMIIAADWLNIENSDGLNSFMVIIQAGAILAVVTAYRQTLASWFKAWLEFGLRSEPTTESRYHRQYSLLIAAAVIPFGAFGYLNRDFIISLFTPSTVAIALIVGGIVMVGEGILSSRGFLQAEREKTDYKVRDCIILGLGQCLSLWPGFSRAAATILAARFAGYSRPAAAELSFLIGLPTIIGTSVYELTKTQWNLELLPYFIVGCLIAWAVAYFSVLWLIAFLRKYSLGAFGWYRIAMGSLLLLFF